MKLQKYKSTYTKVANIANVENKDNKLYTNNSQSLLIYLKEAFTKL